MSACDSLKLTQYFVCKFVSGLRGAILQNLSVDMLQLHEQ